MRQNILRSFFNECSHAISVFFTFGMRAVEACCTILDAEKLVQMKHETILNRWLL
jgi:hypothetical protein